MFQSCAWIHGDLEEEQVLDLLIFVLEGERERGYGGNYWASEGAAHYGNLSFNMLETWQCQICNHKPGICFLLFFYGVVCNYVICMQLDPAHLMQVCH
jgi:hypothetical protein